MLAALGFGLGLMLGAASGIALGWAAAHAWIGR
jgi:hypothetical protein